MTQLPLSIEFRGSGDKGTLSYQLTAGHNIKDGERGFDFNFYPAGSEAVEPLSAEQKDMFAGEIEGFLEAIRTGASAPVTPQESRDVLRITLAILKSLEEGAVRAVTPPPAKRRRRIGRSGRRLFALRGRNPGVPRRSSSSVISAAEATRSAQGRAA
jgi:hypothetical protein